MQIRINRVGGLGHTFLVVFIFSSIMIFSIHPLASASDDNQPVELYIGGAVDAAETNEAISHYIFSRRCETRLHVEPGNPAVIPFKYPSRPTITTKVSGREYDLLFDTGTFCCLLQPGSEDSLPEQLVFSGDPQELAPLEAKRAYAIGGELLLEYALAPAVSCSEQVYIRDVPFRIYPKSVSNQRDYDGAFAVVLLSDYIVVVDNIKQQIELHDKQTWLPPLDSVMLPLLMLPRGYFVPVWIEDEQYWFHFDTGFSGEIGLTDGLHKELADKLEPTGLHETYSGWHAEQTFTINSLDCTLQFLPYPAQPWDEALPIEFYGLHTLNYSNSYSELEGQGYRIGGIIGSGVWQHYCYAIDFQQNRLHILSSS